ncbi:MAG: isoprenylcysteine carboxylmethyltransferase family protein [Planctomycetota bacterium]
MNTAAPSVLRRKLGALLAAALCHGSFVVAIVYAVLALWSGMTVGLGPFEGTAAWIANGLLLAQFPLIHSFLLSRRGHKHLVALAPGSYGRTLAPTTFSTVAALQLLVTVALWSPTGTVWWRADGALLWLWIPLFAASWLFLVVALKDGGLGLQTGAVGWRAMYRGTQVNFGGMPTRGTFALCRQPIYLGFALTLWTGPVWTPDHLFVALVWTVYCVLGPRLKERRYALRYGAAFEDYRSRTPFFFPRPIAAPRRTA